MDFESVAEIFDGVYAQEEHPQAKKMLNYKVTKVFQREAISYPRWQIV